MGKVSVKINGESFEVEEGKTILDVALENNIEIPTLCFHPDLPAKEHCGMCVVKIEGSDELKRACATVVIDGMDITTESEELQEERIKNLDKVLENHLLECDDCVWFQNCKLLELSKQFGRKPVMEKKEEDEVSQVGAIVFDQTKCIGCENCTAVCPTNYLSMNEREKVTCSTDGDKDCANCGQCILHCPVGAIEGIGEFEELEKIFADENKTVVVQFAPSIRTSIGEEFGMEYGEIATDKMVGGLKEVGFDFVFDTALGADFTTIEEAREIIERLTAGENLPAMTSCCPAWVKFVEFNYPEFTSNLATSRSPQVMLGGVIKSYWSEKADVKPEDIFVVSVMPCVAKKYEVRREEMKIDGNYPVDMVLTTRELARLFKKNKIDLKNVEEQKADSPLGDPSGAGVIYGSSGGVFESALRTAYYEMTGEDLENDAVKEVRGLEGTKVKELTIGDKVVKLCVTSGIQNAKKILEELKENPGLYDALEVMACPGGCIAGGGQPMPSNRDIIKKRSESLYKIDDGSEVRCAHDNLHVKKVYEDFFTNNEDIRKKILHTKYSKKEKSEIKKLKNSRETL
ncbi:MAG: [FeFe] hydrogenase, group A [Patescibacteria group bacterium]